MQSIDSCNYLLFNKFTTSINRVTIFRIRTSTWGKEKEMKVIHGILLPYKIIILFFNIFFY